MPASRKRIRSPKSAGESKPSAEPPRLKAEAPPWVYLAVLGGVGFLAAFGLSKMRGGDPQSKGNGPAGMRWITSAEFVMGTAPAPGRGNEAPACPVRLDGFWLDEHEVTNAEFQRFVAATRFVTTAERPPSWEEMKKQLPPGTPPPDPEIAGSRIHGILTAQGSSRPRGREPMVDVGAGGMLESSRRPSKLDRGA